jgi:hypothetical protein
MPEFKTCVSVMWTIIVVQNIFFLMFSFFFNEANTGICNDSSL